MAFPSLATDTNAMDLIFCRNVLIYFTPQQTRGLIEKLHQALAPEGWLAVSPSECSHTVFSKFATENFPGAILYRKGETSSASGPRAAADSEAEANARLGTASWLTPVVADLMPFEAALLAASAAPQVGEQGNAALMPALDATLMRAPDAALMPTADAAFGPTPTDPGVATRALANEGQLAAARTASERWIEAEKIEPAAYYLHAMISQELGEAATARRSLQRALYLDADFVLAHFALGNLARNEGHGADAGRHFGNALHLLRDMPPDAALPEADGLTAGRLSEIIETLLALPRASQ